MLSTLHAKYQLFDQKYDYKVYSYGINFLLGQIQILDQFTAMFLGKLLDSLILLMTIHTKCLSNQKLEKIQQEDENNNADSEDEDNEESDDLDNIDDLIYNEINDNNQSAQRPDQDLMC